MFQELSVPRDILVVDDDAHNLLAIEAALGDFGGALIKARSGDEALRQLLDREFALILLDVQMPTMDGFEAARLIRSRPRTQHVPLIFVTAYEQSAERILEGYELGAVDLLFKPIAPEILRAKVSVFVALQLRTAEVVQQAQLLRAAEQREHRRELDEQRQLLEAMALRRQAEEQQRAAAELAVLNSRLTEADRRKDEFLAMLGHELRTPLAPLLTSLELLRGPTPDVSRLTGVMERQLRHLTRLVDDLMDLSRIASGRLELCRERVELSHILDQAVAAVSSLIAARGHTFVRVEPEESIWLEVDPVRLAQVVANLLTNAVRYTDPGGTIELHSERAPDAVVLRVLDDGRGIPDEMIDRIFEPFVQEQFGSGGLGVGLTLVQRLVELHDGVVSVESQGAGQGACFSVRLPAQARGDDHVDALANAVEVPQSRSSKSVTRSTYVHT